jgi:curved DNA-binding protein
VEYKDYYRVLGVPKTASAKEIKSAFRRLARQYHPDVNKSDPSAEARFKEVNEAYEVLGDEEKRRKYDQLGANWQQYEQWQRAGGAGASFDFSQFMGGTGGPGGYSRSRRISEEELNEIFGGMGGAGAGGFSDFFRTFFGGGMGEPTTSRTRRASPRPQAGQDVEHEVEISLEEAFSGSTRLIQLRNPDGTSRRIEIKLQPGLADGQRVRYPGQGTPGLGGAPAGDLVIRVKVAPHPRFKRDGDNLSVMVSAPLTTAMLGGEIEVPTLAGPRLLRIPPETADGRRFRLSGQGMPRLGRGGERGDLYAEVHVTLPRNLTPRQRELFEELARLEKESQSTAAD